MKLVIFDCDGTLVDSQHMICAAMEKAYSVNGLVCPPRATVLSIVGLSLSEAFERLANGEKHPLEPLIEAYKNAFHELRASDAHMEPLYPGAREAVEALAGRGDVVLGVATGKSVRGVKLVLGHHGLYDRFATVQTADTAPSKPHPRMIHNAMRETGIAPRDTVMIGDTTYDIEMARAAGASAIGVGWGYHPAQDLRAAGAERVLDDFAQLLPALDERFAHAPAQKTVMRDIFEEIFIEPPLDPMVSARQGSRFNARKRFYQTASAGGDNGILLDGKPVRTPARRPLAAPNAAIAEKIADEWNAQVEIIEPGTMPLTRLANIIIDAVTDNPQPVADEIGKFLESDLVCYRAGEPEALVEYQAQHWDPVLAFAREKLGARFVLAQGVTFQAQPPEAVAAARKAIPSDPWALGALSSITTLTGSALIALALSQGVLTVDDAWTAAHADEDFQMRQWGRDELAMKRRAFRETEMRAAALVLRR